MYLQRETKILFNHIKMGVATIYNKKVAINI